MDAPETRDLPVQVSEPSLGTNADEAARMDRWSHHEDIKNLIGLATTIDLRCSEMAQRIPQIAAALASLWLVMFASRTQYAQIGAIAPIFPILGVFLCMAYLRRDWILFSEAGRYIFAAMKHERILWVVRPARLEIATAHVRARGQLRIKRSATAVQAATFPPLGRWW